LSYLLHHARNTETSQPKDRFYALLGLADPRYEIPINYNSSYSMNTVLSDVARAIIIHEDAGLDILSQAGAAAYNRRLPQGSDHLPTWVPDWDIKENSERGWFIDALELPMNCGIGTTFKSSVSFSTDRFDNASRILEVKGIIFDTLGVRLPLLTVWSGFNAWSSY